MTNNQQIFAILCERWDGRFQGFGWCLLPAAKTAARASRTNTTKNIKNRTKQQDEMTGHFKKAKRTDGKKLHKLFKKNIPSTK